MPKRADAVRYLKENTFDIVVIGGGATGTGVALDAALRGLNVALIEAGDFASGTSGVSTKLIHGGVRYLEKAFKDLDFGQFSLVVEALHEREHMLKVAPHLSHEQGIIIPIFTKTEFLYYGFGLKVYDSLSGGDTQIKKSRLLEKQQITSLMPELKSENLNGGVLYFDGQFDDALFNISLARTAERERAVVTNYTGCLGFNKTGDGKIESVKVQDYLSGEQFSVRCRVVINCTGPYSDTIRKWARPEAAHRLRPSRGIHILLDREFLSGKQGLLIPRTKDGRVIFALPWYESVLVGTTETEVTDISKGNDYTVDEIRYLINYLQEYLAVNVGLEDVRGVLSGMRPLVASDNGNENTESLIRSHEIESWENEHLINVLGGKWTTYRKMAEDAVDAYYDLMKIEKIPSKTIDYKLIGAPEPGEWDKIISHPTLKKLPEDILDHISNYGTEINKLIRLFEQYGVRRLHPNYPFTTAEVYFGVLEMYAHTIEDILSRRTRLEVFNRFAAEQAAPLVAEIMAKYLGWNDDKQKSELEQYLGKLNKKDNLLAF